MSFSSLNCDFRPKVCFSHLDPKGLKSCHFQPARQLHPFFPLSHGISVVFVHLKDNLVFFTLYKKHNTPEKD
ncbi:hypothetical protein HanIR_Chr08g0351641 [Helianthus annuus]|nr:hypothetical protein HanIR_Chr08g0351641 [Helianthus annuus]